MNTLLVLRFTIHFRIHTDFIMISFTKPDISKTLKNNFSDFEMTSKLSY